MASKSDSERPDNLAEMYDVDDAKNAMSDIEQHMETLAGYNRDLSALLEQGETETTKKSLKN